MANIISISLNDEILNELTRLEKDVGFSGRSEAIRAGLRMLLADQREKAKLQGVIEGVLVVVHDDSESEHVSEIRHRFERVVKTHIHNQLKGDRCLEIFVINGDARDVKSLVGEFETGRKVSFVKLVVS